MPILSLPLPRIPLGVLEHLPIRVPFPFMRIASILPHSINEPFKASLLALFRLAWSAKLQIPVLITVVFMACDIRLQLEINIIWEANNRPPHANRIGIERGGVHRYVQQRRASPGGEDYRRAALVASALYQQQRRRLIQEIRSQQTRQRETATTRRLSSSTLAIPPAAPLAIEEDSDLECCQDSDGSESDTLTGSQRSTTSEAGMFGSDEVDTEDAADANEPARKKKMKKRSRPSSREPVNDDNREDDDEDTTTDEDEDDDDNDHDEDDDFGGGGGANGGSGSSHFGGGGRYRDDSYDHDSDDMGDDNSNDEGGTYSSPLVVEVEIRHRSLFSRSDDCQMQTQKIRVPLPFVRRPKGIKSDGFSELLRKGFPSLCSKVDNTFPFSATPLYYL